MYKLRYQYDDEIPSLVESQLFWQAIQVRQEYIKQQIAFPYDVLRGETYFPISIRPMINTGYDDVFSCEYIRLMKCEFKDLPTLDEKFIRHVVIPFYKQYYQNDPFYLNKSTSSKSHVVYDFLDRMPSEVTGNHEYDGLAVKSLPLYANDTAKGLDKTLFIPDRFDPSEMNLEPVGRNPGWLFSELIREETLLNGRWRYLGQLHHKQIPVSNPIPRLNFNSVDVDVLTMLENSLNAIDSGYYQNSNTWADNAVRIRRRASLHYFIDWLLWSLGHDCQPNFPQEKDYAPDIENPKSGVWDGFAHNRLIQIFNPTLLLVFPSPFYMDWLILKCPGPGESSLFIAPDLIDQFLESQYSSHCHTDLLLDLDCGTGAALMLASNHSLELMGLTDNPLKAKMTLINSYFYAPWNIFPLKGIDRGNEWVDASAQKSFALNYSENYWWGEDYTDLEIKHGTEIAEQCFVGMTQTLELSDRYNSLMPVGITETKSPEITLDDPFVLQLCEVERTTEIELTESSVPVQIDICPSIELLNVAPTEVTIEITLPQEPCIEIQIEIPEINLENNPEKKIVELTLPAPQKKPVALPPGNPVEINFEKVAEKQYEQS